MPPIIFNTSPIAMFQTDDAFEFVLARDLSPKGRRAWPLVRLSLVMPWYFIECNFGSSKGPRRECFLLAGAYDLEEFIRGSKAPWVIAKIYLVSPPWLNQGQSWQMDTLEEVVLAEDPRDFSPIEIYACAGGRRLVFGNGKRPVTKVINERQIYVQQTQH